MSKNGLLLIISGPSGVGKTTIARAVEDRCEGQFSVSMTTRPQTEKDREGVDYYFVDEATFTEHRENGDLLEWAEVFGNCYGTPREPVETAVANGELMILEIDVEGAVQVRARMPEALAIFIEPPDESTLLERLRGRGRDEEDVIQARFAEARREIERAHQSGVYDVFIVNDELDAAIERTVGVVQAEFADRQESSPSPSESS
ncbi:MAG: guanylate kinase [Phycisphaeraceae bacterium]|nr:guanylate kinase [Phycisphaeraceae bacterium]